MNRYTTHIILAISLGSCLFASDNPITVDWSKSENLSTVERTQFWNQVVAAIQAAGYVMPSNVTVTAEYMNERDSEPFEEVFFTLQGTPSGELWVRCLYPMRNWLKLFEDLIAGDSAEKYDKEIFRKRYEEAFKKNPKVPYPDLLDTITQHPRAEAEKRARVLAKTVGNVDVTEWKCASWSFYCGQWKFTFQPFFKEHRLRIGMVQMGLSDSDNLKLCLFHNTFLVPLPKYDRVPDVIPQAKAREFADKYLSQYVYRGRPPYLTFLTNILEVARPNYWFTDKYDETGKGLKSTPRWSWTAYYARKIGTNNVGFSSSMPVCIVVDALTGEFLGGED